MPLMIGLLIVVAAVYQLFFRYESWQDDKKPGVMYEHDNLTGQTHQIKPGSHLNVFARILGQDGQGDANDHHYLEPLTGYGQDGDSASTNADSMDDADLDLRNHEQVAKVARPVPTPREVVVASSAPPVPNASEGTDALDAAKPFAVRQIDLNRDGSLEEIIQNAVQSDGLLDISIVKNGREIFFGRGKQISLLPSRNQGWADIALKMGTQTLQVFRYNAKEAAYRALDNKS